MINKNYLTYSFNYPLSLLINALIISTREITLTSYFIIKNLEASEVSITDNILDNLCPLYDYVIERYKEDARSDGNYRFVFKIFNSRKEETSIKLGDWLINSIKSNLCYNPSKYIAFDLSDKKGNSCLDHRMPYFKAKHKYWQKMTHKI